ncbi:hypothetical protein [Yoonia sp.]|uniref:hypothetical protein n=1 Tax=Yoonia sp. TaxID=2212373 RepID=UPI003F6B815A
MQIAFHIGAHCTDEDRLIKSLLKNANTLCQQGIAVPGPSKYRVLIRQTIQALNGASPPPDARDILIDAICENDGIDRIVMSNDNFICVPNRIFENGVFYGQAEPKVRALHQLFAEDEIALFLAIRNPATFLQSVFTRANATSLGGYLGLLHPDDISWADVVRRIRQVAPGTPLTVWCNEDSPLLWDQLIRRISGAPSGTAMTGGLDLLASIITDEGMAALSEQLRQTPPATDAARHEMIADIWALHARTDQLEDVIELAELDADLVKTLTENYEEDLAEIARMDGVTLLMPFS